MSASDAETAIRQWFASRLRIQLCTGSDIPRALYNFDPAMHHLFRVSETEQLRIGGSRYIAVNKQDGSISDLGLNGE